VPQAELFQYLQLAQHLFKALVEGVEDFVEPQLSDGVLATALCFIGVRGFRWFWHGTCWTDVCRSLQVGQDRGLRVAFLA
jgi:hypothetical protein